MMPMLEAHITPDEAAFLTGMPFRRITAEELADMKDMDLNEMLVLLEALARKGLIYVTETGEATLYGLNDSFFTFLRSAWWGGITDDAHRDLANKVNDYFYDGWFDQFKDTHIRGLRTIPIEQTIEAEDGKKILPFEDIVQLIEDREYYTVSNCPCRMRHNLDPEKEGCEHPIENCLHFDDLGRYCVRVGIGREITKEETFRILKEAADAGLVHGISNELEKPDTICNCCNDACMWFASYHILDHDMSLDPSNYRIEAEPLSCKACALCVKRCPMDALSLVTNHEVTNKFKKSVSINPDRCIGCGVCAHKCPGKCLTLVRNEETTEPPKTGMEIAMGVVQGRAKALQAGK